MGVGAERKASDDEIVWFCLPVVAGTESGTTGNNQSSSQATVAGQGEILEGFGQRGNFHISVLANLVGDGASPPQRCWLPSCSWGNCFAVGRGSICRYQFLSDSSLPFLAWGHERLGSRMSPGDGRADLCIPWQPC